MRHWIMVRRFFIPILAISLNASCSPSESIDNDVQSSSLVTSSSFETYKAQIRDGDIIFRGRDAGWGNLGAQLSDIDKRYGHVGVIRRRGNNLHVIHAAGDPLQDHGRVREDSLDDFLTRSNRSGLYRLTFTSEQRQIFDDYIDQVLQAGMPFDTAYSLDSLDALYCTELIWRGWMAAIDRDPILEKTEWRGKNVLALDDLQLAQGMGFVSEISAQKTP